MKKPNLYNLNRLNNNSRVEVTTINFVKDGNKWVQVEASTESVDKEYMLNLIEACPAFRRLGGYERVNTTYTSYGILPYELNSINPDRTLKTLRKFKYTR